MKLKDTNLLREQTLINGEWINADSNATFEVTNPSNGEVIAKVPDMGATETRRAIEAAYAAFPAWRAKTAKERGALLRKWHDLLLENIEDLAALMTYEQGKPLAEAAGEVKYAASFIDWFAEEGKRVYGDTIPTHKPDARLFVMKEPVGVAASVTPWNFPIAMIARKVAPALAVGCTFVSKPAEHTPLSALATAYLAQQAGIPAGVFNVVTGKDPVPIGNELTSNPLVRKITFTGSTPVGKLLLKQSAATVKKVSMELGGNAPFIVFDDADLDAAVQGAMIAKYRNTGQTCVCANRIYVQTGIYDAFVEKLTEATQTLKVGDGFQEGVSQGPLIDEAAVEKVERHVNDAVGQGAKVLCGGKRHALGGTFFQPTVLRDVRTDMLINREETFGPVAAVIPFETEEEAIQMANDTEFGLAAYFYTRDVGRVFRVGEALEYGLVGANEGLVSTEIAPFGGVKESGLGREGSKYGVEDYLEIKYMMVGGIS